MAKDKPDVVKLPHVNVLKSLISQSNTARSEMDTVKGEIGEKISNAVSKHNLHAGAFKLVNKLQRMDAVKLMAFLTHFDDYRVKLELDRLAAPDLPGMEGDDKDDDKDENGQPKPMFDETKDGTGDKAPLN